MLFNTIDYIKVDVVLSCFIQLNCQSLGSFGQSLHFNQLF